MVKDRPSRKNRHFLPANLMAQNSLHVYPSSVGEGQTFEILYGEPLVRVGSTWLKENRSGCQVSRVGVDLDAEVRVNRLEVRQRSHGLFKVFEGGLAVQCPDEGNLFREKVGKWDGPVGVVRNEILGISHMTKEDFDVRSICG